MMLGPAFHRIGSLTITKLRTLVAKRPSLRARSAMIGEKDDRLQRNNGLVKKKAVKLYEKSKTEIRANVQEDRAEKIYGYIS